MLNKKALLLVFCCVLFLTISPLMFGQATGSFSGTVSDKTGSVIAGATVRVTSQGTAQTREAKTDDTGHYLIPLLPIGQYTVRTESQGFQPTEQKDIRLQVDEQREVNFTLAPASVSSTVEVSATEVVVETTSPALGQVITSEQVADLPLNGRDFVQLATLTPGTTQETNTGSFFNGGPSSEVSARGSYSLSVGGSRANSTDWLLDGNDNNELTAGGISILPSIDAIQEFKVLTYNYSAEFGTRAGPTVLVTTKSGSNQIHGSLFEFFRNTSLDAASKFAVSKERFNLNQFGGSVGGALEKDKTFFFLDYQGKRQRRGQSFVGLVPTADMMAGDFTNDPLGVPRGSGNTNGFKDLVNPYTITTGNPTGSPFQCDGSGNAIAPNPDGSQSGGSPCNKIPAGLFDNIGAQLIQLYPANNVNGNGFNFSSVPVRKLNEGEFDVRVDHNFSGKDSMFARFSYDQAVSFIPGGSDGFSEQNAFGSTQNITNHGRNIALSETHVFSDRTINQINGGFNRIFNKISSFGNGTCKSQELGIPGANLGGASCGLTSTQLATYWALGDRGFAPFQGGTNVFSISDSFDMIRGNHNIHMGGSIRANQMNVQAIGFQDGFWVIANDRSGDAAANLLLGLPDLGLHDTLFEGSITGRRWKMFRPFVQDDWRVTKDLTLNLGVAWSLVTPVTEAENRQSNFDFASGKFLVPGLNSDGRVGVQWDKTAFEPRIGLAWKFFGSQNTALRAGYAIFHDASWNQGAQGLWQNPPFFAESAFFNFGVSAASATVLADGFPLAVQPTDPAKFGGAITSQNLNFKQGRMQQFNLNIEHQLPGDVVVTAGYAGSRGSHILVYGLNLNVKSPLACGTVPGYTLGCGRSTTTAPYPQFPTIANANDVGASRYDSLQVKAETKSARHGLYALLGYTYARNFDSGYNDGLGTGVGAIYWPLPNTTKADWALSQIQLNHQFTASVLYDLPFGKGKRFGGDWNGPLNAILGNWRINVIEKVTSGFPVFIIGSNNKSGVNFTDNGASVNRPNQTCAAKAGNPTIFKWFNTQCFTDPPAGELGTASRSPVYGPGFVNTDFSVIKRFVLPFREGMGLDFRTEVFNIFNHPQYALPGSDVDSPSTFGVVNSTVNNPRLVQFALKLQF